MESLLLEGWKFPLSDKVLVDREALLELIDQMRVSTPEDVREAQEVLLSRDGIIAKAEEDAAKILREAEGRVEARLRDTEVMKEAEARAEQIISSAQETAERIRQEAERTAKQMRQQAEYYCLDILKRLEGHLLRQLATVQGGIKSLQSDYKAETVDKEESGNEEGGAQNQAGPFSR